MYSNRNLRTANVGDAEEVDLAYDIGAAGAATAVVNSGKWTLTRQSAGVYRLTAKALVSQRAVKHIAHSIDLAVPVGTAVTVGSAPVLDAWTQANGYVEFKTYTIATGAAVDPPNGSRIYLRVKQETTKVSQRG
jgi:hypothetical protein